MFFLALRAAWPLWLAAQPVARVDNTTLARAVDSLVQRAMRDGLSPGLGVALVRDGHTILQRAYGFADASRRIRATTDTRWYVASTTKSFTGFAMALLADDGRLPFDTPASRVLPNVRWHASVHAESLTVARFLSHTHGLDDNVIVLSSAFSGAVAEEAWPSLLALVPPARRQALIYSNFGYNVAGMILDQRARGGWRRVLDSAVFRPAGMLSTTATLSRVPRVQVAQPHRYATSGWTTEAFDKRDVTMHAAGGHVATVADLARWVRVQIDTGVLDGRVIFPASAIRRAQTLLATHTEARGRRYAYFDREGWGAGWDLGAYDGTPMVSRFGGYASMRSHLSFLPSRRVGVVAMANGGLGSSLTDLIAAFAYDLDAGHPLAYDRARARLDSLRARFAEDRRAALREDSLVARQTRTPPGEPRSRLIGRYESAALGTLELSQRGGRLAYRWGVLSGFVRTVNPDEGTFRINAGGAEFALRFEWPGVRGAAPTAAVWVNNLRLPRAVSRSVP